MLHLLRDQPARLCDEISRRECLQIGGASLPALLRGEDQRKVLDSRPLSSPRKERRVTAAKGCILLYLAGGPSHLDMWDMKPLAPAEIRGEFKPVSTTVPGVQVSDQLPRLARQMHRCTLVRSAHHTVANAHWAATYFTLTGEDRGDFTIALPPGPNDYPAIGSVLTHLRPPQRLIVPFVSLPYVTAEGAGGPPQPGIYGGWLGRAYDPLIIDRHRGTAHDPNAPDFGIPELTLRAEIDPRRLDDRKGLLGRLDRRLAAFERGGAHLLDAHQQRAFSLLTSEATRRAFDLSREPAKLRDVYGRNIYGQSVLLARRLIEAGTRMVTLKWAPDANATWDTHANNFKLLKTTLLPQLDACLPALLEDLEVRGLLRETLVICMGEFGRSPRVNPAAGRDHWPRCYSLLLAGGGSKGGYVHGQSDRIGSDPAESPVTPQDLLATFYHLLGIPPETELPDQQGRPIRLVGQGKVLAELIA
jgi:hypothetical protein